MPAKWFGPVLGIVGSIAAQTQMSGPPGSGGLAVSAPDARFAGASTCAGCHVAQAKDGHRNSMTNALSRTATTKILRDHAELTFREGPYSTTIVRGEQGSTLIVTDGKETIRAPLQWAFGQGMAGQTYIFEHAGAMYESRVSYYEALKGLDLTMGAQQSKPANLVEAAGRRMDKADIRDCFGCHSTGGARRSGVVWESMSPGVSCEGCHGPGADHASAMRNVKTSKPVAMRSLGALPAEDMNELCGSCHRTWAQVIEMNLRGPLNVRFQPYRITNSKCFDAEDRRIACTACHNPHGALEKTATAYDSKCAACHSGLNASKSKKVCHTGKSGCVTCHMPKLELAGSHYEFADHQIRIVKPGDPYPN